MDFVRRRRELDASEGFDALHHIDLEVEPGRSLGIIGRNGSGKSTLLKIIAGIYRPDAGTVAVQGRVAALIELGAGFHPELTGRENVMVNGIILGLSRHEVRRRLAAIIDFADIGGFIDEPVRTYASGMFVRLGFAVAIHLDPDVLLVDEVLAVGDREFQTRCYEQIARLRQRGTTLVLVTHDALAVERWCDEALWLDGGIVRATGAPRKVIGLYHQAVARAESAAPAPGHAEPVERLDRWGTGEIEIVGVRLVDGAGADRHVYETGESMTVSMRYRVNEPVPNPVFGFGLVRADGIWVYGTSTAAAGVKIDDLDVAGEVRIELERLDLIAGSYYVDVAVHAADGTPYDYHSGRYRFTVQSESPDVGLVRLTHHWSIRPGCTTPQAVHGDE